MITPPPAMTRVAPRRERRPAPGHSVRAARLSGPGWPGGWELCTVHPLGLAVGEALVLPDRDVGLEVLDQRPAGRERLVTVVGGGGHDHGQVADLEVADAVHGGDGAHAEPPGHLLGDL